MKSKPIYPQVEERVKQHPINHKGMTLLEYYAGLAMQGLLSNSRLPQDKPLYVAKESITYAKALIKELENEGH